MKLIYMVWEVWKDKAGQQGVKQTKIHYMPEKPINTGMQNEWSKMEMNSQNYD